MTQPSTSRTLLLALVMVAALLSREAFVQTGTWTTEAPMLAPRTQLAVAAGDGVLYAVGGDLTVGSGVPQSTLEAYDPLADSWTTKAPMLTPRNYLAAAVIDGVLYAAGGLYYGSPVGVVEAYDPAGKTWTPKALMPGPRYHFAVGVVDGILYAVGGNNGQGYVATVEAYDPAANEWTPRASMPTARGGLAVGVVNGILYAIGGYGGGCCSLTTVEAYDPATNQWTPRKPLPSDRSSLAAAVVDGKLYAIGGGSSAGLLSLVDVYDPESDTWTPGAPMPTARVYLGAGAVDGAIYAVGGQTASGAVVATNEAFAPDRTAEASLAVAAAVGTYGGTTALQATLTANDASPVPGKDVRFTLNGVEVGAAATQADGVATLHDVSLAGLNAGLYAGVIGASFAGDGSYLPSQGTANLSVNRAAPQIAWNPEPLFVGTPLGPGQLNARASFKAEPLAGTFAYDPPAGTVLAVGSNTLTMTFTPADGVNLAQVVMQIPFTVNPRPIFTVNSDSDAVDAWPGDGLCATAAGACTLRAAVQEANALAGADTILFDSSLNGVPITLTIVGTGENAAATGDLDVTDKIGELTVTGNGADVTIIQACDAGANPSCTGIDRLVDVVDGATLNLNGVTLRNGFVAESRGGAAIRVGLLLPWESGYGGRSTLVVSNSRLLNNAVDGSGGAIHNLGNVTLDYTVLAGNRTRNSNQSGGAIITGGTLVIANSTISGNATASGGSGGAIFSNSGTLQSHMTITGSTISGNTAGWDAGGIYNNGGGNGTLTIRSSTVSGNSAVHNGGGIFNANGVLTLASVTISGNAAGTAGSGILTTGSGSAPAYLENTIVANNAGDNCSALGGTFTSRGYNIVDDGSCGPAASGDILADPLLGALADNGGPTKTHALHSGSPAIDVGSPTACAEAYDQRGAGFPRALDGNGDGTARCDVGAFEAPAKLPTATSVTTGPNPSSYGDAVTAIATVTGGVVTDGSVSFTRDGVVIGGPVAVDASGQASATLTGLGVGEHTITAEYGGSAAFGPSSGSTVHTVTKGTQTITFEPIGDRTFGDPAFAANATASSGLPVAFAASGPCTMSGTTVTLTGAGACTITALQAGDTNYNPAPDVQRTFTIADRQPPVLTVPGDQPALATSASGAFVNYPPATATDDVDPDPTISCVPGPGTLFPLGETTVRCTATDASGNTSPVKTFRVIVEDRTPPVLADHADVTTLTSSTTAVLRYTKPTATDAVDPNPGVSCTPEAGTAVALGQTTVTCVATDASGNPSAAKAFNVFVRAVAPPPPVSAGGWFMCRLTDAATVECWGVNNNAELGDGTTIDRSTPVAVSELSGGVSAISTGGSHTCALLKTGGVECWGYNAYGQLGDGTTGNRSRAVAVSGLSSGVLAISAGAVHTCAILDGGAVTCWGANFYGTLGDGTKTGRITPVPVSGLGGAAVGIAAGGDHTCALLDDGGVKCWGRNSYGQIGDGTQTDKLIPTAVSGLSTGAVAVVAGGSHTCALLNGGGVKCWGSNNRGNLGDGTRNPSLTPVAVSGLSSGVIAIDAGPHAESEHTCAVTTGGTAMCWGSNRFGQLGTGTDLGQPLTPVAVSGLSGSVSAVTAGMFYSCALLSNGSLQCWGSNYYGQLGDGTTIARLTPVYVLGVPLSADVSAGGTLSTGIEATADQPLQVSVTTPNPGPVSIELSVTTDTVWNYRLFDRQTIVHAPDATPGSPLQLTFRLDATLVGASDPAEIDVFRDGVAVAGCGGSIGAAVPDPCLASRTTLADGDLQFAVYTSHASQWNFGVMLDSTPPTLSLPGDIRVEATSAAGAVVDYPMPFATDDIDPNPTVSCTPASGSVFAIGTTIVWCSAQDAVGNAASANFTVTVQDTTVPVISSVPVNQTLEATGPAGAVATWTAPTASDLVDGAVSVTCAPAAGATVAVGTTTVTCTATDAQGNGASVSFTVTVQDTTAPVLTLPSGITVDASSPSGATVAFAAAAVDLVDGSVGVSCTPSAGSEFAVGTTMVACSAADAHGNRVSAGFSVTVRSPAEMTENLSRLAVAYGMPQSDKLLASVVRHATGSGRSLVAACNDLRAFMNQTRAQAGKRLTADQANALTSDALRVQSALGCR